MGKLVRVVLVLGSLLLLSAKRSNAGIAAYGICQAGCASVVMACYAAAGAIFGTVTAGVGTPAAVVACNTSFGTCQAACVAAGLAPVP